jgi:predicted aspartyl protease
MSDARSHFSCAFNDNRNIQQIISFGRAAYALRACLAANGREYMRKFIFIINSSFSLKFAFIRGLTTRTNDKRDCSYALAISSI